MMTAVIARMMSRPGNLVRREAREPQPQNALALEQFR